MNTRKFVYVVCEHKEMFSCLCEHKEIFLLFYVVCKYKERSCLCCGSDAVYVLLGLKDRSGNLLKHFV